MSVPDPPANPVAGSEEELRAFVGPKADYYLSAWEPLPSGRLATGFNPAAFFLSGLWLGYRKMYGAAATLFAVILIESILEDVLFLGLLRQEVPAALTPVVTLAVAVICGAFGNRWYLARARRVIADVRSRGLAEGLDEEVRLRALAKRGGTSVLAAAGLFVLFLVVSGLVGFASALLLLGPE